MRHRGRGRATPDHPRHISVREDALLAAIRQFFGERIFGPERAALLAAQIPAPRPPTPATRFGFNAYSYSTPY